MRKRPSRGAIFSLPTWWPNLATAPPLVVIVAARAQGAHGLEARPLGSFQAGRPLVRQVSLMGEHNLEARPTGHFCLFVCSLARSCARPLPPSISGAGHLPHERDIRALCRPIIHSRTGAFSGTCAKRLNRSPAPRGQLSNRAHVWSGRLKRHSCGNNKEPNGRVLNFLSRAARSQAPVCPSESLENLAPLLLLWCGGGA